MLTCNAYDALPTAIKFSSYIQFCVALLDPLALGRVVVNHRRAGSGRAAMGGHFFYFFKGFVSATRSKVGGSRGRALQSTMLRNLFVRLLCDSHSATITARPGDYWSHIVLARKGPSSHQSGWSSDARGVLLQNRGQQDCHSRI